MKYAYDGNAGSEECYVSFRNSIENRLKSAENPTESGLFTGYR